MAAVERLEQPRHLERVVLQIGVHGDDVGAARGAEARGERRRLAEVAAQAQAPHPRVGGRERLDRLPRAVAAPVVDEDDLDVEAVAPGGLGDLAVKLLEARALVADGDDDGDHAWGRDHYKSSGSCGTPGLTKPPRGARGRRIASALMATSDPRIVVRTVRRYQ